MNHYLTKCNKKKSTFEALAGISFKQLMKNIFEFVFVIGIIAIGLALIFGFWYLNWQCVVDFFTIAAFKNPLDFIGCFLATGMLICVELILVIIILSIFEYIWYDIPLLLNLRYLPCTKEEILSFDFKNDEEFIEFAKSICKKGDHYCQIKHMKKEIRTLVDLYISSYNKESQEIFKAGGTKFEIYLKT